MCERVSASWNALTRLWHQQITIGTERWDGNPARPGAKPVGKSTGSRGARDTEVQKRQRAAARPWRGLPLFEAEAGFVFGDELDVGGALEAFGDFAGFDG